MNQKAILAGAFAGFLTSIKGDLDAFKAFKSFDDAAKYSWGKALERWAWGSLIGAMTGAGMGQIG